MANSLSKEVLTRERNARSLQAALEQQGHNIARRLAEELGTPVDDPAATFLPTTQALARSLTAALTQLVTADDHVAHELARLQDLRKTRDQAMHRLRQSIVHLRRMLTGHYVSPNLVRLGIGEHTARSPFTLLRQANRLTQAARGEDLVEVLGAPFVSAPADFHTLFLDLAPTTQTLRTTLQAIDEAQRDLDLAREERRQSLATFDRLYLHTARTLESFCHLANEPELAERIRPTQRSEPQRDRTRSRLPDRFAGQHDQATTRIGRGEASELGKEQQDREEQGVERLALFAPTGDEVGDVVGQGFDGGVAVESLFNLETSLLQHRAQTVLGVTRTHMTLNTHEVGAMPTEEVAGVVGHVKQNATARLEGSEEDPALAHVVLQVLQVVGAQDQVVVAARFEGGDVLLHEAAMIEPQLLGDGVVARDLLRRDVHARDLSLGKEARQVDGEQAATAARIGDLWKILPSQAPQHRQEIAGAHP